MPRDIYQEITDQIVQQLEQGVRPWQRPWSAAHMEGRVALPLRENGVPYRGVNIITFWMAALAKGYTSPIWMTFKQAIDLGGGVRKAEKGSLTVYADNLTRTETDTQTGEEAETAIHFKKGYTVFNVEQIDGLAPKTVQTFAGHSSMQLTMDRYGHLFRSDDHGRVIDGIASQFAPAASSHRPVNRPPNAPRGPSLTPEGE